jgi:flagellar biosynthesis protein FlhB
MAEDSDLERTEPASQRRLEQARERGEVARSPELSTLAVLLAGGGGLMVFGTALVRSLEGVMRDALTLDHPAAFEPAQMMQRLFESAAGALVGMSPLLLLVAVVALLAPMLVSGWLFTFEGLRPDFSRLDPLRGLGRILSLRGAIEMGKALLKILLVGGAAIWVGWSVRAELFSLFGQALEPALGHLGNLLGRTFLILAGAFAVLVALDVAFQIWDHRRQLRMTKNEVREELKETEGNPLIKARIRSMQREARRRRMMAAVSRADVIIANPTHYAVALRYRDDAMRAPRVIANGSLLLAERMLELAQAAGVPTLRAPALARALFAHAESGRDIPPALYIPVAEVLAWVYQVRRAQARGEQAPPPPVDVPVPGNLDPSAELGRLGAEHS